MQLYLNKMNNIDCCQIYSFAANFGRIKIIYGVLIVFNLFSRNLFVYKLPKNYNK